MKKKQIKKMFMKIRKFQIKFFLKIQKLFKSKILNFFDLSIYIVIFIQFVSFNEFVFNVVKTDISNDQHIFFEN